MYFSKVWKHAVVHNSLDGSLAGECGLLSFEKDLKKESRRGRRDERRASVGRDE